MGLRHAKSNTPSDTQARRPAMTRLGMNLSDECYGWVRSGSDVVKRNSNYFLFGLSSHMWLCLCTCFAAKVSFSILSILGVLVLYNICKFNWRRGRWWWTSGGSLLPKCPVSSTSPALQDKVMNFLRDPTPWDPGQVSWKR